MGRRSHRAFGLVFALVFAAIGAFPLLSGASPHRGALGVAGVLLGLALLLPRSLALPSRAWGRVEMWVQKLVSALALVVLFYAVVTPMALLLRLLRRDPLGVRPARGAASHWTPRRWPGPPPDMLEYPF